MNKEFLSLKELDIYDLAFMYCDQIIKNGDINEIDKVIEQAIKETISVFDSKVTNANSLKDYLNEKISRERESEDAVILYAEDVRNSEWWTQYKGENKTNLKLWGRYAKYLLEKKNWERSQIKKSIDYTTDMIMNAIANPTRGVPEERRGMVVGYVQSGKTANYIGLINKAFDSGYKMVIVLAGIHNNLRSQTQSRIDEEVLGYDTESKALEKQRERAMKNKIGVGLYGKADFIQTLTTRDENGDFSKAKEGVVTSPDVPTVIVTKKTKSTLENLIKNIKNNQEVEVDEVTGKRVMKAKYPVLIIDDEADQASVNTKYQYDENLELMDEYDITTINKLIRELLSTFECRSYIGYTATPYANIFIPNPADNDEIGNDLFPAHCIVSLPKPPKYIGANEFYGSEDQKAMPLTREIKSLNFIDIKQKRVNDIPKELKEAMQAFIIGIAVRNCRGDKYKPKTMLIHVARLKDLQKSIVKKVESYYESFQEMIIDEDREILLELENLLSNDFNNTTKEMFENHSKYMDGVNNVTKEDVFDEIQRLMENNLIKIKTINGDSKDALAYKENENSEYNVIAIGGDKLSRGLTLEGLMVSYFTRESKYYDTLMQMGRWFGFRPKYADLCRLYTSKILFNWFKRIGFATDNLREQIIYMCEEKATPETFGLKVATHPILKISNPSKIKVGLEQKLDFECKLTQTRDIDVDAGQYENNFNAVEKLLLTASETGKFYYENEHFKVLGRDKKERRGEDENLFWHNVKGIYILKFLEEYKTSKHANKVNSLNILNYIKDQVKDSGLINWTICLMNMGTIENSFKIAGKVVKSGISRSSVAKIGEVCSVKTITSDGHEYLDFDSEMYEKMQSLKKGNTKGEDASKAEYIRREIRKKENGLLLIYPIDYHNEEAETINFKIEGVNHKPPIGIAIVFPKGNGKAVSYKLNIIASRSSEDELFD